LEAELFSELLTNSRRNDRKLAIEIGISQSIATRLRTKMEKERYIKKKTIISNCSNIEYNLLTLNFEIKGFRDTHLETIAIDIVGVVMIHCRIACDIRQ